MRLRRKRAIWPGYATAHEAIQYLASACDGAIRRDGHGFRTDHVHIGHWLAHNDPTTWGPNERQWAHHLIRIYRQQLSRAGFNAAQILDHRRPPSVRQRQLDQLQPGWSTDPTGLYRSRWWNGARWTASTRNH